MIHQMKLNDRRPAAPGDLKRGLIDVDLTDALSVTFKMTPINQLDKKVDAAAYILDRPTGNVEYRWAVGDTDKGGEYDAEWEVIWSDGTPETFPTIGYDRIVIHGDLDDRG